MNKALLACFVALGLAVAAPTDTADGGDYIVTDQHMADGGDYIVPDQHMADGGDFVQANQAA